jgi:hypothetical protein
MRVPVAVVPLLVLVLGGCGAEPPTIGPTGVDELTVPTPDPDAADFVDGVDNPWLPLRRGSTWTYRSSSAAGRQRVTVTVADGTRAVAGVATTVVHEVVTGPGDATAEESDRWFAQDRAGNVWLFGEHLTTYAGGATSSYGSWQAGIDGAEAALAMPAVPRVGDGYRTAYAPGVVEAQAQVQDLEESVSVPYGDFDGVLETEDSDPRAPGVVTHRSYAEGVGLVRVEDEEGPALLVELVSFRPPK